MRKTENQASLLESDQALEQRCTRHLSPSDNLTRQAVELSRLDVRIAELLLCLYEIPRLPGSALPRESSTGERAIVGTHPL